MQQAKYPWIARLDADDEMDPRRLDMQMTAARRDPSVVLWGSYAHLIDRNGKILRNLRLGPTTEAEFQALKRRGSLITVIGPTVLFRRDLALRIGGYDARFNSAEDLEFLHRMIEFGSVRTLPESLSRYRIHGSSITAGRAAHQQRLIRYIEHRAKARADGVRELALEEFLKQLDAAPAHVRTLDWLNGRSRQYYRNASLHHAEGRWLQAVGSLGLSFLLSPSFSLRRAGRFAERRIKRNDADMSETTIAEPNRSRAD